MRNDAAEAALGLLGLTGAYNPTTTPSTVPAKRKQPPSVDNNNSATTESIDCICRSTHDDGFSIGCDSCWRWCHAACFDIVENGIPDEWHCWVCEPRNLDKDRSGKTQKARSRSSVPAKRKASPGVERKPRRPTVTHDAGTHKRKRRASINVAAHPNAEDEHVDIDEPWTHSYVPITKDIIPADDTRDRLRRVACDWRGVTAISPSPTSLTPGCTTPTLLTPDGFSPAPHITLQPVPTSAASFPSYFANGNASVRPPSYAIHATQPIPHSKLITPYPSTIIPTAAYLRDPLNAYAHLGMPKPYVHLFGPPLDVALDARITGDQSRFVRNGCRPNAILRPIFCQSHQAKGDEEDAIKFGIFALRDLKANEEVVLGWEWDDENVVHHLPALIQSPFSFPPHQVQQYRAQMTSMLHALASTFTTCACGSKARDCVLTRLTEFVENQTPLTPSPSPPSQFAKEKHGVSGKSEQVEDSPIDLGPLIGIERGFRTRERIPFSGGMGGVEVVPPSPSEAGPSRLPHTGRRVSFPHDLLAPTKAKKGSDRKGKRRADDVDDSDGDSQRSAGSRARRHSEGSTDSMDIDPPPQEARLPPKLRKAWIARSAERLRERNGQHDSDVDMSPAPSDGGGRQRGGGVKDESYSDSRDMPPPPVPPSRTPPITTTHLSAPPISASSSTSSNSSTSSSSKLRLASTPDGLASPSLPFSKLSLLSPVVPPINSAKHDSSTSLLTLPAPSIPTGPVPAPASSSSSAKASAKSDARKARKSVLSAQPHIDSDASDKPAKPAKSTKPRTKGKAKEKDKDKDKDGVKEKEKAKDKVEHTKKAARPRTPATDPDEPLLKPSLLRREDSATATATTATATIAKSRPKAGEFTRSPATAANALVVPPSPPPPPTTPVVFASELPPEPRPCPASPAAPAVPVDVVDEEGKDAPTGHERMDVDPVLPGSPKVDLVDVRPPVSPPQETATGPAPSTPDVVPPSPKPEQRDELPHLPAESTLSSTVESAPLVPSAAQLFDVEMTEPEPSPVVEAAPVSPHPTPPSVVAPLPEASAMEVAVEPPTEAAVEPTADVATDILDVPAQTMPDVVPVAANPPDLSVDTSVDEVVPRAPSPQPLPEHEIEHVQESEANPELEPNPEFEPIPEPEPNPELNPEAEPEPEPEPEPEHPKAPPAPPKVKLSLKDFAMRKKKLRAEQAEREKGEKELAMATASPETPMSVPLPLVDLPQAGEIPVVDSELQQVMGVAQVQEGGMRDEEVLPLPAMGMGMGIEDGDGADRRDGAGVGDVKMEEDAREREMVSPHEIAPTSAVRADDVQPAVQKQPISDLYSLLNASPVENHAPPSPRSPRSPRRFDSPPSQPRARLQSPVDLWSTRDAFAGRSLETKVEILDSFVPAVHALPPIRERERSPLDTYYHDSRTVDGYHDSRAPDVYPDPRSLNSFNHDSHMVESRYQPRPVSPSTSPRISPKTPHATIPIVSQQSQEDGEILSPPPRKAPPLAPRSHSPPTQPRSFYMGNTSPTRRSPAPSARQPLVPSYSRNTAPGLRLGGMGIGMGVGMGRPSAPAPPNAPRALRQNPPLQPPPVSPYAVGGGQNAPYYAPRGPSADRERERERERERDRPREWGRERERDVERERTWIPGPSRGSRGRGTSWGR